MKRKLTDEDFDDLERQLNAIDEKELSEKTHTPSLKNGRILLYNDDVNSMEYVISVLHDVLGLNFEQAEQLAIIAHFKGVVEVKRGSDISTLIYIKNDLVSFELICEVEVLN